MFESSLSSISVQVPSEIVSVEYELAKVREPGHEETSQETGVALQETALKRGPEDEDTSTVTASADDS